MVLEANLFKITYFELKLIGSVENKYAACVPAPQRLLQARNPPHRVLVLSKHTVVCYASNGQAVDLLLLLVVNESRELQAQIADLGWQPGVAAVNTHHVDPPQRYIDCFELQWPLSIL